MNEALTKRQVQIIRLLADGKTTKETADHIFRCRNTVLSHIFKAKKKLGAKTVFQLAWKAREVL